MGRSSGKRFHRKPQFKVPKTRYVEHSYESYGIITRYHGGQFCTVMAIETLADQRIQMVKLDQVKLKGSLKSRKCGQRLDPGSYVLLSYGEVALVYRNEDAYSIPSETRMYLQSVNPCLMTKNVKHHPASNTIDDDIMFQEDDEEDITDDNADVVEAETEFDINTIDGNGIDIDCI